MAKIKISVYVPNGTHCSYCQFLRADEYDGDEWEPRCNAFSCELTHSIFVAYKCEECLNAIEVSK